MEQSPLVLVLALVLVLVLALGWIGIRSVSAGWMIDAPSRLNTAGNVGVRVRFLYKRDDNPTPIVVRVRDKEVKDLFISIYFWRAVMSHSEEP